MSTVILLVSLLLVGVIAAAIWMALADEQREHERWQSEAPYHASEEAERLAHALEPWRSF